MLVHDFDGECPVLNPHPSYVQKVSFQFLIKSLSYHETHRNRWLSKVVQDGQTCIIRLIHLHLIRSYELYFKCLALPVLCLLRSGGCSSVTLCQQIFVKVYLLIKNIGLLWNIDCNSSLHVIVFLQHQEVRHPFQIIVLLPLIISFI